MDKDIRMNHSYFTVELGKAVFCTFFSRSSKRLRCLFTNKIILAPGRMLLHDVVQLADQYSPHPLLQKSSEMLQGGNSCCSHFINMHTQAERNILDKGP